MRVIYFVQEFAISLLVGWLTLVAWNPLAMAQQQTPGPTLEGQPTVTNVKMDPKEMDRGKQATAAPPNHAILSSTLNGWQFVPKELKNEYDATLSQLESLQFEADAGKVNVQDALAKLAVLKNQLEIVRAKLEASRVFVAGAKVHEQTESIEFQLGRERRLTITANDVRVVGWNEAKVKVELRKIVLSVEDEPIEHQLKAIRIQHHLGPAAFAGLSEVQREASEKKFLESRGDDWTAEQLSEYRKRLSEVQKHFAIHQELLGKDIDQLSVAGLDYQSNPLISTKVKSEGGDGQWGTARQRYAELTVYVPACESVCVRGAKRGLKVENLMGSLTLVDEGSTDSDARGRFEVDGLRGNLKCKNFPLHRIANVDGHVSVESFLEFGVEGMGTSHRRGMREMTAARPFAVKVANVTDGVTLRFGQVALDLDNISGTIDVENQFGSTRVNVKEKLSDGAHRLVSQSGPIEVRLSGEAWNSTSVVAATNYGGVRTNIEDHEFGDFRLSGPDRTKDVQRGWSGFRKTSEADEPFSNLMRLLDRLDAVEKDAPRSNGLDILTGSGQIIVMRE